MDESKWIKPQEVTDLELAFGGNIDKLMPAYEELTEEFQRGRGPYCDLMEGWFFKGLRKLPKPKEGIDLNTALRHLGAILVSFEPKQEHKIGGTGYLASLWFELPTKEIT